MSPGILCSFPIGYGFQSHSSLRRQAARS